MKIRLMACKEKLTVTNHKLKATEEKMKSQGPLLDSAEQALSKRELSSSTMISSAVANAMALMKNHLSDLDMEILHKGFTVDDAERETLVNSTYDAAHDFVSMYDFFSLLSPMMAIVPQLCNSPFICCNKLLLVEKNFDLILLNI
jgi:hypothetical protein